MPSIHHHPDSVWHGWDVHKDTISVAVLHPGQEVPATDRIFHDEPSVRRLIDRCADRRLLRVCYEAAPDRLRAAPAVDQHGRALRRDRPVAGPQGARRQSQDRQASQPQAGPPLPLRRADRHPRAHTRGGGGAGPVPRPRRPGRRPAPRPPAAGQPPAAPRARLAGRQRLDARPHRLAGRSDVRPARPDRHVRPLPGGAGRPQRRRRRHHRRPEPVV